ncbi:MAG: GTP-binding protein, partial [Patulibacter sp.]|nr:GTP-binding protein [Patulibacter sp.]
MQADAVAAPVGDLALLVERAGARDAHAVARLVSVFQDRRPEAVPRRAEAIRLLDDRPQTRATAPVIGVTGTPGSGKSSLLGRIAIDLLDGDPHLSVAVLAIDPSSKVSGGALLGDRTRLQMGRVDHRLFFRSEASDSELGGLSPSSFQVCRLLTRLFDVVFVETVGIGQSEADVRALAEHVYLVIAPLGGDEVQYLKAGIIEIPDAFIVNKCDERAADAAFNQLKASLWMARPFDADDLPVHRTSAKSGAGLPELTAAITGLIATAHPAPADLARRDAHFFQRWVQDEWGRSGVRHLLTHAGGAQR